MKRILFGTLFLGALVMAFFLGKMSQSTSVITEEKGQTAALHMATLAPHSIVENLSSPKVQPISKVRKIKKVKSVAKQTSAKSVRELSLLPKKSRNNLHELLPSSLTYGEYQHNFAIQGEGVSCRDESCRWDWKQGALLVGVIHTLDQSTPKHWTQGATPYGEPALAMR